MVGLIWVSLTIVDLLFNLICPNTKALILTHMSLLSLHYIHYNFINYQTRMALCCCRYRITSSSRLPLTAVVPYALLIPVSLSSWFLGHAVERKPIITRPRRARSILEHNAHFRRVIHSVKPGSQIESFICTMQKSFLIQTSTCWLRLGSQGSTTN